MESSTNVTSRVENISTSHSALKDLKEPTQGQVLMKLFYHSVAMFSLPFIAYYYTKHLVEDSFDMTEPRSIVYAAISSVICIQGVIFSYVYQAFKEEQLSRKIKALGKKD
ncbi:hypothetical protein SK128_011473 [Halocaridina rubra]|uniref:Uncharacterized protein n=1 Tax=Halocaridina rubra TaxID=373956 RepID=A0AAN8XMB6_HALRR